MARGPHLQAHRGARGCGAAVDPIHGVSDQLQYLRVPAGLPAAARPGFSALQSAALQRGQRHAGPGVQYGRQFHHQHELAELQRGNHPQLLRPNGRADGAELRLGGGRPRHRHRSGARVRAAGNAHDRQFLGRRDAGHGLRPAPDVDRRRSFPVLARRDSEPQAVHQRDHGGGRQADHPAGAGGLPGSHQGVWHQRRRLLQRQLRPSLREPHAADELLRDVADLCHTRRLDLHLRANGGGHAPRLGYFRRVLGDVPGRRLRLLRLRASRATRSWPNSASRRRLPPARPAETWKARRSVSGSRIRRCSPP